MTFLEALYGSQYCEIEKQGKDGNKGRLNANLFLSALVILLIFAIIALAYTFAPGFAEASNRFLRNLFGHSNGKVMGKILAIPLLAIIYFSLTKTVGSEENFKNKVEAFKQYPEEVQKKANAKLLIPFFILLVLVFGLAMRSSFG